jgi:hypothetical protein
MGSELCAELRVHGCPRIHARVDRIPRLAANVLVDWIHRARDSRGLWNALEDARGHRRFRLMV